MVLAKGKSELFHGVDLSAAAGGGLYHIRSFEAVAVTGCYVLDSGDGHVWHLEILLAKQAHVHGYPVP